jgi:hypothetical protein
MPEFFRQCKSTALQKIAVSPFANRYSLLTIRRLLFATRHSLFAVFLARQEPRPPTSFRPPSRVPRPVPFLSHVPCPVPLVPLTN